MKQTVSYDFLNEIQKLKLEIFDLKKENNALKLKLDIKKTVDEFNKNTNPKLYLNKEDFINAFIEANSTRKLLNDACKVAKMAIYENDLKTNKKTFSDTVYQILDLEPDQKPSFEMFFQLMKADYKEQLLMEVNETRSVGKGFDIEFEIVTLRGNHKRIRTIASSEMIENKPVKTFAIIFDITDEYEKNEILRKSQEGLSAVFENTSDSFILIDLLKNVSFFNKSAYLGVNELFGMYLEINKPVSNYVNSEDLEKFEYLVQLAFEGRRTRIEKSIQSKNGEKWFRFTFNPVLNNNKITHVSIVATDFTDLKNKENENIHLISELRLHNEELLQFSYIISHNLRAPVANILGLTDLLLNIKNVSMTDDIVHMLREAGLNLDKVIFDLNEILSLRRFTGNLDEVNLFEVFEGAKQLLARNINEVGPEFIVDFQKLRQIFSMKGYIQSFFYNFISNSLKYRRRNIKPVITITSDVQDNYGVLIFSDNGTGIDLSKYGTKIFGLYQRFHAGIEGKGFGLHLVHNQVKTLGGEISVESTPGVGTQFKLLLPLNHISRNYKNE
ncbi:MAG: PAS domain-containing sensor histidine kinase [Bacteroidota bacterium]|nr:PAS domain-containing sensor histidine kinase [Bacteroidota bacterium]